MFTVATLVLIFTITTPGPYICSKQLKTFHVKCNLKVNREEIRLSKPSLIVWNLQISTVQSDIDAKYLTFFCKLPTNFHEYCLFDMSLQFFMEIVFSSSDWKTTKISFCATVWPISRTIAVRSKTNNKKWCWNAQQISLHDCKLPQQFGESWQTNCLFRLYLGLAIQIMEFEDKQAYRRFDAGVWV